MGGRETGAFRPEQSLYSSNQEPEGGDSHLVHYPLGFRTRWDQECWKSAAAARTRRSEAKRGRLLHLNMAARPYASAGLTMRTWPQIIRPTFLVKE